MPDKSDVAALGYFLDYVTQEAQRLSVSPVVVLCLRMAIFELTKTGSSKGLPDGKNTLLH